MDDLKLDFGAVERQLSAMELTEEETQAVKSFSAKIDLKDASLASAYGAAAYNKIALFAEKVLCFAAGEEADDIGTLVGQAITALNAYDSVDSGKDRLLNLFKRTEKKRKIQGDMCNELFACMQELSSHLEAYELTLTKNVEILAQLQKENMDYFRMLTMYIQAGHLRLMRERETTLASMKEIFKRTAQPGDKELFEAFEKACGKFEERLFALEQVRAVVLQMDRLIVTLQGDGAGLSRKTQRLILGVLPAWREQAEKQLSSGAEELASANETLLFALDELLQLRAEVLQSRKTVAERLVRVQQAFTEN